MAAVRFKNMKAHPKLQLLNQLLGVWTTEGTHPAVPGVVVHGTTTFEWLEGERFLIVRSNTDHPDFPDGISIIGDTGHDRESAEGDVMTSHAANEPLRMQYFDSRGVFRVYDVDIDEAAWRWRRESPGFSQQFTGTFADDGDTILGQSQLRRDDIHWADDLRIIYRRKR
jgi:hypothetical protein